VRGWILVGVLGLVFVACGDGEARLQSTTTTPSEAPTTVEAPVSSVATTTAVLSVAACDGRLAEPGEYEGLRVLGEVEQPYWMVVPEVYAEIAPAPLYLHLASGGGDHDGFLEAWRPYLHDVDGLMAIVNTSTGAAQPGRSSPVTLVGPIEHISDEYCLDPARVHVMATSWSSGMADRLACEASDQIASFVSAFGGGGAAELCTPDRPVPLLSFTGGADRGGVTALVNRWIGFNGCDADANVENLGSGVSRVSYENCAADVVYFDIEGMGHAWPMHECIGHATGFCVEYDEVDYLEEALRFFADHPLP
jgi:hypothetical protein